MKFVSLVVLLIFTQGCTYSQRVQYVNNDDLCRNLGKYTLYDHKVGIQITRNEIDSRNIEKHACSNMANETAERLASKYKLKLCQNLAIYHYKGAYEKFKDALSKIEKSGFADEECNTMADFYLIRLARKQEKAQAISRALNQAAENMRRTNDQLYGRGSYLNPIHVKID